MNLLMVHETEDGKYRRGKDYMHILKVFEDVVSGKVQSESLQSYLSQKTIVNVPNFSLHSMVCGPANTYVIEPGNKIIDPNEVTDFTVLTNFPFTESLGRDYRSVEGPGSDRYKIAHEMISEVKEQFDEVAAFSVLQKTAQHKGNYPTQMSLVFLPHEQVVYFSIHHEFDKVFQFSFSDQTLSTRSGFHDEMSSKLTKHGILLSELSTWN